MPRRARYGWLAPLLVVTTGAAAQNPATAMLGARAAAEARSACDTLRLDLASAVRIAAEKSYGVEVARQASEEARTRIAEERADLLPSVTLLGQHGDRTFNTASFGLEFPTPEGQEPFFDPAGEVIGPVTTVDVRGHVAQTLFDWSAVKELRRAEAEFTASRTGEDGARQNAAGRAATAYVQAAWAEGRLQAREGDVALARELVTVARELLDAGTGVRLDVTRAEAQLASMEAQLLTASSGAERARLALLRALNLPLDTPLLLADGLGVEAAVAADESPADALARRPDVREVEERLRAAELDVDAIRAERLPSLSVVAGDGFTGSHYDHLLNTYEWAFQVSVPVFDGRARAAREDAAHARVAALEARRAELEEEVGFAVRDALLQMDAAWRMVGAARTRLDLAEAELAEARERFQAGVAGSADVVNASLRLNEARTADVDARATLQAARVALAVARGAVTDLR